MKSVIPIKILSIEGEGFHLLINALINGSKALLLIDTGASRTVFDKLRITKFLKEKNFRRSKQLSAGLGTNTMESHTAAIGEIRLGSHVINKYKAVLLDLSHVNESYEKIGFKPIDGVLGSDLLIKYKAAIDYGKKKLFLN